MQGSLAAGVPAPGFLSGRGERPTYADWCWPLDREALASVRRSTSPEGVGQFQLASVGGRRWGSPGTGARGLPAWAVWLNSQRREAQPSRTVVGTTVAVGEAGLAIDSSTPKGDHSGNLGRQERQAEPDTCVR